jgi:hypothetical protein
MRSSVPASRPLRCGLRLLLASLLLGGLACATPGPDSLEEAAQIRRGAKIRLGGVDTLQPVPGIDSSALLREAMEAALADDDLLWSGNPAQDHYVLDLRILKYRPGNAFKRWLLPGYGSTILRVDGELLDPRSGAPAATLTHGRSVFIGGAYTIGAWKTIFRSVADDLARDLRNHSEGRGFFVSLSPWATRDVEIPLSAEPRPLRLGAFVDRRPDRGRIGERQAAFGASMGDVHFSRDVADFLRETVSDDLRAAGHTFVDEAAAPELTGEVLRFWVHTDTTPLYWDVIGEIELRLVLATRPPRTTTHACESHERTWTWPSKGVVAGVLDDCLTELMAALRADPIWRATAPPPTQLAPTR